MRHDEKPQGAKNPVPFYYLHIHYSLFSSSEEIIEKNNNKRFLALRSLKYIMGPLSQFLHV